MFDLDHEQTDAHLFIYDIDTRQGNMHVFFIVIYVFYLFFPMIGRTKVRFFIVNYTSFL